MVDVQRVLRSDWPAAATAFLSRKTTKTAAHKKREKQENDKKKKLAQSAKEKKEKAEKEQAEQRELLELKKQIAEGAIVAFPTDTVAGVSDAGEDGKGPSKGAGA